MKTTTKTVNLCNFKTRIVINEKTVHLPKADLIYELNLSLIKKIFRLWELYNTIWKQR